MCKFATTTTKQCWKSGSSVSDLFYKLLFVHLISNKKFIKLKTLIYKAFWVRNRIPNKAKFCARIRIRIYIILILHTAEKSWNECGWQQTVQCTVYTHYTQEEEEAGTSAVAQHQHRKRMGWGSTPPSPPSPSSNSSLSNKYELPL